MDISSILGTVLSSDSLQNISSASNADKKSVKNVLSAALPKLLEGMQAQNKDESTGFADALLSHGKKDTSDLSSFLGNVDLKDGGKIIAHLLGDNSDNEIKSIAKESGVSKKKTSNILSAAAPLIMSLLGQQASSSASDSSASAISSVVSLILENVDVGSILTSLLSGSDDDDDDNSSSSSGGLGSIIASLFKKKK